MLVYDSAIPLLQQRLFNEGGLRWAMVRTSYTFNEHHTHYTQLGPPLGLSPVFAGTWHTQVDGLFHARWLTTPDTYILASPRGQASGFALYEIAQLRLLGFADWTDAPLRFRGPFFEFVGSLYYMPDDHHHALGIYTEISPAEPFYLSHFGS